MQELSPLRPPKGFRPAIPARVKLQVVLNQDGLCARCGHRLGRIDDTQFDHVPALQLRVWCAEVKDTVPPANSEGHLEALHVDCHKAKTTGRKGESRLSVGGGDSQAIARTRRLAEKHEEFRRRLLAKAEGAAPDATEARKPPSKWPKRPFPKRPKKGNRS